MIARLLAAVLITAALAYSPGGHRAIAQTTTTVPVNQGDRSVIPRPNSGTPPASAGDRGGWEQLLLFGIMAAGCALIFGRVLWAAHQRSRANRLDS